MPKPVFNRAENAVENAPENDAACTTLTFPGELT
jgi:hypothetical protein